MKPKYSIVIPTFNRCDELLRPCIESIIKCTDLSNVEVIVVANGCTDNTREYVEDLAEMYEREDTSNRVYDDKGEVIFYIRDVALAPITPFKLIWSDEALGYTKATNLGIKAARGEYVILLNNDTVLLEAPINKWLEMLERPFLEKQEMGLTGPLILHDDYANHPVLIFFCVMIKKEVFDKIGLLDEIFSPGGGEDIDFTIRAAQAGYTFDICDGGIRGDKKSPNIGAFPIWHAENKTFVHIPEYTNYIVKRNGFINCLRYNKEIRLNLGGGGINFERFLSVDKYDKRAHILLDITKLTEFADNSVTEIIASHVFEHLNPYHCMDILKEWRRVLKPGGKLTMEMPDIEKLCARFGKADWGERFGILNAVYGSVNTTDEGGKDEITSPHLFGWWPDSIYQHLMGAGFRQVSFGPELWPHPESNMHVEAIK